MLKGDLATTAFGAVITDLSTSAAVGCLHVEGPDGDEALVYFKSGIVYSAFLPGRRPQLGARLISSGALAPEALEEALEAQATELQGWRLGELLVHLGFVEADVVEAFSIEQVRDACFEMSRWTSGTWKFRKNEKTREDISAAVEVPDIIDEIRRREEEWSQVLRVIRGIDSVPVLGAGGLASAEMALDQDEWALLCKVDGERNIHQLARDCGYTNFEAGHIVSSLVTTGLLELEPALEVSSEADDADDADGADGATEADGATDAEAPALNPRSAAARLMAAFSGGDDAESDISDDVDLSSYDVDDSGLEMPSYLSSLVLPLVAEDAEGVDETSVGSELTRLLAARDDVDVIEELVVEEVDAPAEQAEDAPAGAYTSYALPPLDPDAFTDEPYADPDASLPRYSVGFGRRDQFDESLSAVSEALSALLGSQPAAAPSIFDTAYEPTEESEEEHRARVIREAAAAEMSAAHEEMEEQRRRFEDARQRAVESMAAEVAEQERVAAENEAAERLAAEEAERVAAEEAAAAVAELAAQEEEARRVAEEAEAARRAAEQEAEAARRAAEQEAEAAALAAAEDSARIAAEEAADRAAEAAVRAAEDAVRAEEEAAARAIADEEEAATRAIADAEEAADAAEAAEAAAAAQAAAQEQAAIDADNETARLVAALRATEEAAAQLAAEQAAHALLDLDEPAPAPPPPPPPAPVPAAAPVMTDTASLMRELSSLGFDDDAPQAQSPNRPSTSVGASSRPSGAQSDKGKKRKGLFGRG